MSRISVAEKQVVIERGKRYALVGESGGGKTTFLLNLRGVYTPDQLCLTVDGRPVVGGFGEIARAISLLPQEPEMLARSVMINITMGAQYPMEFIRRFTDMACITETIDALPRRFESLIQEDGANLSGGQKQRLALARGLLASHDKDIVLMDEPTSSLDPVTEWHVYDNIFTGFAGKTIVSTVHRMHLLPMFDHIYMFEQGKIIASGTLEHVLATCDSFRVLWERQRSYTSTGLVQD